MEVIERKKVLSYKYYSNNPGELGEVGEYTGYKNFYVGDIVALNYEGRIVTSIICKEEDKSQYKKSDKCTYFVAGLYNDNFEKLVEKYNVVKVVDYSNLTEQLLQQTSYRDVVQIDVLEKVKVKVSDLEKMLGYKIEIIGE